MTERFEIFSQNVAKDGTLIIIQKGLKLYNISDVVDLLNELHEEVEYLKPLANENTHYIADMEDDIITFKQKIEKLEKENEQLQKELNAFKPIIFEDIEKGSVILYSKEKELEE